MYLFIVCHQQLPVWSCSQPIGFSIPCCTDFDVFAGVDLEDTAVRHVDNKQIACAVGHGPL